MTEPSTEQSNPDTIARPALFPSGGQQDTTSPFGDEQQWSETEWPWNNFPLAEPATQNNPA